MKTTFIIIAILALGIFYSEPTISFKPFSVTFEKPYMPFAALCLIGAIVFYSLQYEEIGFKKGQEKGFSQGYEAGFKNCREQLYKTIDIVERE